MQRLIVPIEKTQSCKWVRHHNPRHPAPHKPFMSLLLAAALAAATPATACSWNDPGHNPYRGSIAAAVDRYTDIPVPVRERLKARMATFRFDEMAAIRRDSITGQARYAPEIRDMHFGAGQVCGSVDRSRWTDAMVERGLVYCEDEHCLIVPTVCRNVSRITRLATPDEVHVTALDGGTPAAGGGALPSAAALPIPALPGHVAAGPDGELVFDPTGAGPSFEDVRNPGGDTGVSEASPGTGGGSFGSGNLPPGGGIPSVGGDGGFSPVGGGTPPLEPIALGNLGGLFGPTKPPGGGGITPTPPVDPALPELPFGPLQPPRPPVPDVGETLITPITTPVPEPGTAVLMLLGAAGLAAWRRRRPH
jgi:hypothetical protein